MVSFRTVPGSLISKATTMYKIQSRKTGNSEKAEVVDVERRFNDFRLLHEKLLNDFDCQGCAIPPLPMDDSLQQYWVHTDEFLMERARGLDNFLRVAAAHDVIKRNENFKSFLTVKDFEKSSSMVGKFFKAVG